MSYFFYSLGFQDPRSPFMEGIVDLHNYIFFYLVLVVLLVMWFSYFVFYVVGKTEISIYASAFNFLCDSKNFSSLLPMISARKEVMEKQIGMRILKEKYRTITHAPFLEIIWTLAPSLTLLNIAVPSFALLYCIEEINEPELTVRIIGNQWYWSYEYPGNTITDPEPEGSSISENFVEFAIKFDSYMLDVEELRTGDLRLLATDAPLVVPTGIPIRLLILSKDVIHSFALPALGVKVDALPGRINSCSLFVKSEGTFYGQCSEICGVKHGFMPIVLKALRPHAFSAWIASKIGNEI